MKCKGCGGTKFQLRAAKKKFPTYDIREKVCKSCGYKQDTVEMSVDISVLFKGR